MAGVTLRNIKKSYGKLETIHGVDIDIVDGEFVVFVGPSGCGKSTLLRMVAGLEDITSGDMLFDGRRVNDLTPKERGIAMVFQSYALYPHMTVYENMAFGLELGGAGKDAIRQKVLHAGAILELTPLLDRLPKQLSGGQRQRVAIGRAIVRDPQVFLFDEPLSNLDAALRVQMRIEIAKLHREMKATMIYVTHDQVEAMTLADKIVVLSAGRVEQIGGPLELYHHPANLFVAGFIGSPQMNFIEGEAVRAGADGVEVRLPGGGSVVAKVNGSGVTSGAKVKLGVRPEHLAIGGGAGSLTGTPEVIEQLGESHFVHLRIADGKLITLRAGGDATVTSMQPTSIVIDGGLCHVFTADGKALRRLV